MIGFDPHGSWLKIVFTYKFFTGQRIWKYQTGERAPFWCTDLIFTGADGRCFMPPMIVHQAANYTQYLHWNLPSDWLVHCTPSGYMYRDGWMKEMSILSRTCGSSKMNPQVLFFDGHDSHFDDRATHILRSHRISPFILKAGDSTNDQPNDNGPNRMLKRYYSIARVKWQRQRGIMKFTPTHMNYVLVESGIYFNNNHPVSSLMRKKNETTAPCPT